MGVWDRHMNNEHSKLQHEFKLSCSELDALRRQQEILIDLGFGLGNRWNELGVEVTRNLMDMVEGSRGLGDRVKAWAVEFDKDWEARPDDRKQDYLIDIDHFFNKKFDALVYELSRFNERHAGMSSVAKGMKAPVPTVVSIQVVPVRFMSCDEGGRVIEAQISGPTVETTCWGIYERLSDGIAIHAADAVDERVAEIIGKALAEFHHVEVEHQPWKGA